MRKQYVSLLALILTISGFLFSCGDKTDKNTGALKFDSICVNQTVHLFNDTAKPACNLIIHYEYPVHSSDEMLKDSLNAYFLSACFACKDSGQTSSEVVKEYTQNYIQEYLHDLEPMYAEDEKNPKENVIGAWYSYYKNITGSVQFYEKNLLVYRVHYDEYTGGAHGNYIDTFLNMDLSALRPLQLSDLFVEEYEEPLTDLIWKQLMTDNKVTTREALEDLGFGSTGEITPTENFYLEKEGISFYFNTYDITPYVMGPVVVKIPFETIASLLNSNPIIAELKN